MKLELIANEFSYNNKVKLYNFLEIGLVIATES